MTLLQPGTLIDRELRVTPIMGELIAMLPDHRRDFDRELPESPPHLPMSYSERGYVVAFKRPQRTDAEALEYGTIAAQVNSDNQVKLVSGTYGIESESVALMDMLKRAGHALIPTMNRDEFLHFGHLVIETGKMHGLIKDDVDIFHTPSDMLRKPDNEDDEWSNDSPESFG